MEPRRILIADDERLVADTFAIILANNSYIAVAASSGEEALSLATSAPFDAALIDVIMPGMDGFETARRLRALLQDCEIILSSGHGAVVEQTREGLEVLAKPIYPEDLLQLLRKLPY